MTCGFPASTTHHGGNVQVLSDPHGFPVWTGPVEPGSTHDLSAARTPVLPALYPAAAVGLLTLTDKGYTGAGIGIQVPTQGRYLPRYHYPQPVDQRAACPRRTRQRLPENPMDRPYNASAWAPGEPATSPPQPSSYPPSNAAATEKTSLSTLMGIKIVPRLGEEAGVRLRTWSARGACGLVRTSPATVRWSIL